MVVVHIKIKNTKYHTV